ncbi:putative protective surface antigen precursor (Outer membrane protein D15) [Bradyrhizobium sp. ORS 375]|uniref:outer membrane protein assembly factor BamA n=1 Tax=Bradyrhizobium sp. (strain ORS 375) TaxID=566679 RepID=UPI000240869F|nr:outer membrane protein assembly factor BamA [Bradyrhizobium sp. ORS 375]CCD97372.1 putative protective surface antigen precursor (Outer membrane protein D15) [Bradyrhizobium sp. ORS 375]
MNARNRRPPRFASLRQAAPVVAVLSVLSSPVMAASPETLSVQGNRRVDAEMVRSFFHADANGRYDAAALDAGLKSLVATGLFEDVKISRIDGRIVIRLAEAKLLDRVAFEGNKKVKDADLTSAVLSKPRSALQRATVQGDVARILQAYHRVGRDDVRVAPEIIDRGNDRVDLVFTIIEGKKTPVRAISFVGNSAYGARQLRAVIKTSESTVLSFVTGGDAYDADRVNEDREQLRQYYRNHGYADAEVTNVSVEFDRASNGFNLSFTIDEGVAYKFGAIDVSCNVQGLACDRLRPLLLAQQGERFDASKLDKSTEVLTAELGKLGFPFAQVEPRINRNARARLADVSFQIDQGQRSYVERIDIHGNTRTRDEVVRREFDIGEGDAYNKTLIDRAERRLRNLNYFKTVKITSHPGSSRDRVVLDVEAVDQATGDFNVSGGYSSTDGLLAEVKIGDRNVLGTGNTAQATFTYGQFARGATLSFTSPYALGRLTPGVELFARQSMATTFQSFGNNTYGGAFTLGMPVSEQTAMLWRYSLYDQKVVLAPGISPAAVSVPVRQAIAAGRQTVSQLGNTVTYSTLDSTKMPTSGVRSQLSQDLAGLGGDVRFLKTTADVRYYRSINSDLTAMVRGQGGYITGFGGQQAPLLNSFFGGPTMVRGFAPGGFGPRDLTAGSTMDNVGGSFYWATTAELQSNIPGLPQEYGLRASAFVDTGTVFGYRGPTQNVQVANKNVLRSSVGVGMTWASPFGPLTVDYAVPISKAAYDVVQPFRFSAGGF